MLNDGRVAYCDAHARLCCARRASSLRQSKCFNAHEYKPSTGSFSGTELDMSLLDEKKHYLRHHTTCYTSTNLHLKRGTKYSVGKIRTPLLHTCPPENSKEREPRAGGKSLDDAPPHGAGDAQSLQLGQLGGGFHKLVDGDASHEHHHRAYGHNAGLCENCSDRYRIDMSA